MSEYDAGQIERAGITLEKWFVRLMDHHGIHKSDKELHDYALDELEMQELRRNSKPTKAELDQYLRYRDLISMIYVWMKTDLLSGAIVAFGRKGGPTERYDRIPSDAWDFLELASLRKSHLKENSGAGHEWFGVRIFDKSEVPERIDIEKGSEPQWELEVEQQNIEPTKLDEQIIADPNEPPQIPPFPKYSGELMFDAIKAIAREHPVRFMWGYSGAITAGAFAKEVASPTRYSVEACRKMIREQKPEIMKIINATKSDD